MRYIIMIFDRANCYKDGACLLVPYSGVVHETKQEALKEFLEASREVGRVNVYLTMA